MRASGAGLLTALLLMMVGCHRDNYDDEGYADCRAEGGAAWTSVLSDPQHCGACGRACPTGAACVDGRCPVDRLNCGAFGRQCVAVGGEDVACVRLDGEAPPDGVEAVNGYACVPLEEPAARPSGSPPVGLTPTGRLKRAGVQWLVVPGATAGCEDGPDALTCETATVDYVDLCGQPVSEPFAYDFAIMTEEMSRGLFRELMCDCMMPHNRQCEALCLDEASPEGEKRDQLPITGVHWCEAYQACREMGARLPTVREQARLESLAAAPRELFEKSASCESWAVETGQSPWLAECLNAPIEDLELDATKGTAGQIGFGQGILTVSEPMHHWIGNVDEWVFDSPSGLIRQAGDERTTAPDRDAPRLLRGRSVYSPAGQPGGRLIAVDPSLSADDVGLRCAWTTRSPEPGPIPYDVTQPARYYARCIDERTGVRPVRRFTGEQVFRAVDACLDDDREMPDAARRRLTTFADDLLIGVIEHTGFARLASLGEFRGVGPARFSVDEQWWLTEPVVEPGKRVEMLIAHALVSMSWDGERDVETTRCRVMGETSPTDGRIVRRHDFVLDAGLVGLLGVDGSSFACRHLACVDPTISAADCASACPGWRLPLAIDFRRIEPDGSAALCSEGESVSGQ